MSVINDKAVVTSYMPTIAKQSTGEGNSLASVTTVKEPLKTVVPETASLNMSVDLNMSSQDLDAVVAAVNNKLAQTNNHMEIERDEGSGRDVFLLIDSKSKEVIKQFPTEEFLQMSQKITEYLEASLYQTKQDSSAGGNLINSIA